VAALWPLRRIALAFRIMDVPGPRKGHKEPVPYLGGIAILLGAGVTILVLKPDLWPVLVLLAIMAILGFADDVKALPVWAKLAGEVALASTAIALGYSWHLTDSFVLNAGFSILWIVGLTNSLNLLDNMDGLASTAAAASLIMTAALVHSTTGLTLPLAGAAIKYAAEAADKLYGKVYGVDQSSLSYELRRPLGVVAGLVGGNFPLVLAASKIGPALATGNSLILKPSELTSLSAGRVAELAIEAGVPEGVLNVVHGDGATGAALARHSEVDLISFTGSSQTGKLLMAAAGQSNMKRLLLECGGKAPNIVFDDSPSLEDIADVIGVVLDRARQVHVPGPGQGDRSRTLLG